MYYVCELVWDIKTELSQVIVRFSFYITSRQIQPNFQSSADFNLVHIIRMNGYTGIITATLLPIVDEFIYLYYNKIKWLLNTCGRFFTWAGCIIFSHIIIISCSVKSLLQSNLLSDLLHCSFVRHIHILYSIIAQYIRFIYIILDINR